MRRREEAYRPGQKRAHAAGDDHPGWNMTCPTCGQPPGFPCVAVRGQTGAVLYAFHVERGGSHGARAF